MNTMALNVYYSLLLMLECEINDGHFPIPIIPHATRAPALPVILLVS